MTKVLVLDFDGVISNSAGGWAFFCRKAWKSVRSDRPPSAAELIKHRAYIKNARESFGVMILLKGKDKITREKVQKETENKRQDSEKFSCAFFAEKEMLMKKNPAQYRKLYPAYKFIVPVINRIAKTSKVYIVTSNKKSTILPILKGECLKINSSRVLDNTISENKKELLKIIEEKEDIDANEIIFVEDSLEHLKLVPHIRRRMLASWGFVVDEDIREAKKLGIEILAPDNFESRIKRLS